MARADTRPDSRPAIGSGSVGNTMELSFGKYSNNHPPCPRDLATSTFRYAGAPYGAECRQIPVPQHKFMGCAGAAQLKGRPWRSPDRGEVRSVEDGISAPRSAEVGTLDVAATAARSGSHRQVWDSRWRMPAALPLFAVLALKAGLSARLLRADTAFQDEALYLWAGHRELASLLHGRRFLPFRPTSLARRSSTRRSAP